MIPEEEARKLRLPGSDTFLRTELAYRDEINKGALVTFLNREAYKAFTDSMMPSRIVALAHFACYEHYRAKLLCRGLAFKAG